MRFYDDVLRHVAQRSKAPVTLSYVICATPRSGSTLLCECLTRTGVAGVPDEWMLPSNEPLARQSFAMTTPFDNTNYLAEIVDRSRTPNGVFGIKVMWPEMEELRRGCRWNLALRVDVDERLKTFPNLHYIRMSRRDRLRQAVSLYLAVKTKYWHRMRKDEQRPGPWALEALKAELADPVKRSEAMDSVAEAFALITQQESQWNSFFHEERITPFEVVYEDLVADPSGVTRDVLASLGVSTADSFDFSRAWHLPMSDERNECLLAAYRQHCVKRDDRGPGDSS